MRSPSKIKGREAVVVDPGECPETSIDQGTADVCPTVRIEPNVFYRPAELRRMLGKRAVDRLTQAGLRAVGGWYFGENILGMARRIWQEPDRQRVSGKEVNRETIHATKEEKGVEKGDDDRAVRPAPKRGQSDSLLSQMAEIAD